MVRISRSSVPCKRSVFGTDVLSPFERSMEAFPSEVKRDRDPRSRTGIEPATEGSTADDYSCREGLLN
jgi:hypothetical protein